MPLSAQRCQKHLGLHQPVFRRSCRPLSNGRCVAELVRVPDEDVSPHLFQGECQAAGARAHAKEARARSAHADEMRADMGTVKAAKAAARQFREAGQRPKESSAAALSAVGVKKREKQKRPRQAAGGLDDEGDAAAALLKAARTPSNVYAGAPIISMQTPWRASIVSFAAVVCMQAHSEWHDAHQRFGVDSEFYASPPIL